MKPRTKFEKSVLLQSNKLPDINESQKNWAFRKCIDHFAYRSPKGRTTCMDCGFSWVMNTQRKHCTCPQCGAKLDVKLTFARRILQKRYFNIVTTSGEYQVLRMFLLTANMKKGYCATYDVIEIGQYWWNKEGRMAVVGLQRSLGIYIDSFSFSSPMAIRQDNIAYDYISNGPLYPRTKIINTLKRNGFKGNFYDVNPKVLISKLLSDSRVETLMKSGKVKDLCHFLAKPQDLEKCWNSYKIAMRKHYEISDISLWCDLIYLLGKLGKDLRNPHYICPVDLKASHDKYMVKREALLKQEQEKRRMQKLEKDKEDYIQKKGKFFGLVLTDGNIIIKVLQSVDEFMEEGTAMHHCVYTNAYYNRDDALIMSARIGGKRIETVEFSLSTFKVIQSRGVCNSDTEFHERIISIVENNAELIRKRMSA